MQSDFSVKCPMRTRVITLALVAALLPLSAHAASLRNRDTVSHHVVVCDEGCRQADEDNADRRDFWLGPGESRTFPCYGRCFIGIYRNGAPPSPAEMAIGGEDDFYRGDETADIVGGRVQRRR
ncbi:MAG: hypothetical protein ABL932_21630 [Terricaulis sp.]